MKLIVGLGNPGQDYQKTWHNLGWLILDEIQQAWEASSFRNNAKLQAAVATARLGGEKIILLKPQTYMNNSGQAAQAACRYYKIKPEEMLVIHDDIDLPIGKIRLVKDSSSGGHNGVKSIIKNLKTQNFIRLKIGIKTERLNQVPAPDYVLENIPDAEKKTIEQAIKKAVLATQGAALSPLERAMNNFN